jgi:uncharacterized OsmC-like protein
MEIVDRDVRKRRFQAAPLDALLGLRSGGEPGSRAHERLLLGALGSCTLAAISEHAGARGWDLGYVTVETACVGDRGVPHVARLIEVGEALDDDQHAELMRVCSDTPVTRAVTPAAEISTLILDDGRGNAGLVEAGAADADELRRREAALDQVLEDSFPASDPPPWTCGV